MDFFAHGFWGYILFNNYRTRLAVLFALIPDTVSWFPFLLFRFFNEESFGRPNLFTMPHWVDISYGVGHSLVIAFLVVGLLFLIFHLKKKRLPYYALAYPTSILFDIPTHTKEFLPTPFLWPVSDWVFDGFSWGNGYFMLINWGLIFGLIVYLKWDGIVNFFKNGGSKKKGKKK